MHFLKGFIYLSEREREKEQAWGRGTGGRRAGGKGEKVSSRFRAEGGD